MARSRLTLIPFSIIPEEKTVIKGDPDPLDFRENTHAAMRTNYKCLSIGVIQIETSDKIIPSSYSSKTPVGIALKPSGPSGRKKGAQDRCSVTL